MKFRIMWRPKGVVYYVLLGILIVVVAMMIFKLVRSNDAMPRDWQPVNVALEVALTEQAMELDVEIEVEQVPRLININTATAFVLELLPGIGPVKAQAIVDYRQAHGDFTHVDILLEVPGIGPATMANLEGLITVDE